MKIYLRFVILVAGLFAAVCLTYQSRLQTLREERDRLRSEAPKNPAVRDTVSASPLMAEAIVAAIRNRPGQRTALLVTLRKQLVTVHDPSQALEIRRAAFEAFARGVDPDSTDAAIEWIAETTEAEKALFAEGLAYSSTREASGRWIEWMASNLSPEQLVQPVSGLMEEWTQDDYRSAGDWLAASAESPAKEAAVQAYVEVVAGYEPHVAIQWAMTLPEGPKRDASLSAIHANWPPDDPAGKTAFQRANNME